MSVKQRRAALVTGGARRIGAAIAKDLANHGFTVAIHCNESRAEADTLADLIMSEGGEAAVVQADLTLFDEADALFGKVVDAIGPVDLLVNSASIFARDQLADFTSKDFDRHFALHVKAPLTLSRRFADQIAADGEGLIVNIIDQRVLRPQPGFFTYALSKSALFAATVTMAQALAPRIRVNAIGPGPTLRNQRQRAADFDAQIRGVILKRGPSLDEFGATIRYLWEARSVTGQMIALDGGQHLGWETPDIVGIRE